MAMNVDMGPTNKWYDQLDSDKELFTPPGSDDDVDGEDESISSSLNSEDDVEDNTEDDAGPNRVYGKRHGEALQLKR